jgi:glutaredoxin-like protein
MGIIKDSDKPLIAEKLSSMDAGVTLSYFTQDTECDFCRETREVLEELPQLSEKVALQVFDFKMDQEQVEKYKIDKIPATVVGNAKDYGIRFYGIPAGYEFSSLLEAIMMVSKGESSLSQSSKSLLKEIKMPVRIQVFVTPT